jgi:hypothetical protein
LFEVSVKPGSEPATETTVIDNELWVKYNYGDEWQFLGIAPRPKTVWQTLIYHICNGLLMRYPLWDILVWSWQNRYSFLDNENNQE